MIFDPARLPPRFDMLRTFPAERACEPLRVDADRLVPRADAEPVLVRVVFRLAAEREPAVLPRVVVPARLREPRALEAREVEPDRLRDDAAVRERAPEDPRVDADRVVPRVAVVRDDPAAPRLLLFLAVALELPARVPARLDDVRLDVVRRELVPRDAVLRAPAPREAVPRDAVPPRDAVLRDVPLRDDVLRDRVPAVFLDEEDVAREPAALREVVPRELARRLPPLPDAPAFSRPTSLLKLLCCPPAVWSCTSNAKLFSSNLSNQSSHSISSSELAPL